MVYVKGLNLFADAMLVILCRTPEEEAAAIAEVEAEGLLPWISFRKVG